MCSLPLLDLKGNRPVESVYPVPVYEDSKSKNINWFVLVFGIYEGGELSSSISSSIICFNSCPWGNLYELFYIVSDYCCVVLDKFGGGG